jgi:hypothetical protein
MPSRKVSTLYCNQLFKSPHPLEKTMFLKRHLLILVAAMTALPALAQFA